MQQMILDSIARSNKRKNEAKIDVFSLDTDVSQEPTTETGLPERLISQIITNVFDKPSMITTDRSKLECSICCTDFEDGDEIKILQCLHTHHKRCIDAWLGQRSVCPDCKFNLRSLDVKQLL